MDSQTIRVERERLGQELAVAEREVVELQAQREQHAFGVRAGLAGAQAELGRVDGLLAEALRRVSDLSAQIRGAEGEEARALVDEEAARVAAIRAKARGLAGKRSALARAFDEGLARAADAAAALIANGEELGLALHQLGESRAFAGEVRQDLSAALAWRFEKSGLRGAAAVHEKRRKPLAERDRDLLRTFGLEAK